MALDAEQLELATASSPETPALRAQLQRFLSDERLIAAGLATESPPGAPPASSYLSAPSDAQAQRAAHAREEQIANKISSAAKELAFSPTAE